MRKPTIAALAVVLTTAGCAFSQPDAPAADTVVIATHDSWAMSDEVIAAFEGESGLTLEVRPQGDAGELTNKLALTKDSPVADVAFGVDNAFAGRALDEGVFAASDVELPAGADDYALEAGETAAHTVLQALARPEGASRERVLAGYASALDAAYGGYFTLGRVFAKMIGNPTVMKQATRYGLPRESLMRFMLKLMANLTDPRDGDVSDRIINGLSKVAPTA